MYIIRALDFVPTGISPAFTTRNKECSLLKVCYPYRAASSVDEPNAPDSKVSELDRR